MTEKNPKTKTMLNEGDVTHVSWEDYANNPLWSILVDTVHSLVMYSHHKSYVRDVVLVEQPSITAKDLALRLDISLGESLVILHEFQKPKNVRLPEPLKP